MRNLRKFKDLKMSNPLELLWKKIYSVLALNTRVFGETKAILSEILEDPDPKTLEDFMQYIEQYCIRLSKIEIPKGKPVCYVENREEFFRIWLSFRQIFFRVEQRVENTKTIREILDTPEYIYIFEQSFVERG